MAPETLRDDPDVVPRRTPTIAEQLLLRRRFFGDQFPRLLAIAQGDSEERPRERTGEEFEEWAGIY